MCHPAMPGELAARGGLIVASEPEVSGGELLVTADAPSTSTSGLDAPKLLFGEAEEAEALPRLQPAPGRYRRAFERLHGFERFAGLFFQVHSKPRGVVFKVGWHRGE